MDFSRRSILQMLLAAPLTALLPTGSFAAEITKKRKHLVFSQKQAVAFTDLEDWSQFTVPSDFVAHSFLPVPSDPSRFWAIEKWGPNAAEFSVSERKMIRRVRSPDNTIFYGHGVFLPNEDQFLIGCVHQETGQGQLAGYDLATLHNTDIWTVTPGSLHECRLTPVGTILVASCGIKSGKEYVPQQGPFLEPSAMIEYDLSARKAVNRIGIPENDVFLNHFILLDNGMIVSLSNVRYGGDVAHGNVYIARKGKTKFTKVPISPALDKLLKNELLSITANDAQNVVALTNPEGRCVVFVDPVKGRILNYVQRWARAVSFDVGKGFIFSGPQGLWLAEASAPKAHILKPADPENFGAHSVII